MWWRRSFLAGLIINWLIVFSGNALWSEEAIQKKKVDLQWSGFSQFQLDSFQNNTNTFRLRRVRVGLKVETPAGWQMKIQLDPTLTKALLDLKLSLNFTPEVTLHLGQFKIPFSRESLTSSSQLELINLSRVVSLLSPGRDNKAKGRDIGLVLQGKFSSFEGYVGLFNGAGINRQDDNSQKDLAARWLWSPSKKIGLGYSYYQGQPNLITEETIVKKIRNDVEAWWQSERFLLQGEWLWGSRQEIKSEGGYLLGGYDVVAKRLRVVVRLEKINLDKSRTSDDLQVFSFGLTWFFQGRSKLQINYEIHREREIEVKNNIWLAQLQVGF